MNFASRWKSAIRAHGHAGAGALGLWMPEIVRLDTRSAAHNYLDPGPRRLLGGGTVISFFPTDTTAGALTRPAYNRRAAVREVRPMVDGVYAPIRKRPVPKRLSALTHIPFDRGRLQVMDATAIRPCPREPRRFPKSHRCFRSLSWFDRAPSCAGKRGRGNNPSPAEPFAGGPPRKILLRRGERFAHVYFRPQRMSARMQGRHPVSSNGTSEACETGRASASMLEPVRSMPYGPQAAEPELATSQRAPSRA